MTPEERLALRNKLEADNLKTRAEIHERQKHRVDHPETLHEPELKIERPILNAAQRQVRTMYEQQIPDLPQEVQQRWDAWCDARFDARFSKMAWHWWAEEFAEVLGEATGKQECKLRDELRKEFTDEIAKVEKRFNARILKMRKETSTRSANVIDLPNPLVRKQQ